MLAEVAPALAAIGGVVAGFAVIEIVHRLPIALEREWREESLQVLGLSR